jgi:hypothetical protein
MPEHTALRDQPATAPEPRSGSALNLPFPRAGRPRSPRSIGAAAMPASACCARARFRGDRRSQGRQMRHRMPCGNRSMLAAGLTSIVTLACGWHALDVLRLRRLVGAGRRFRWVGRGPVFIQSRAFPQLAGRLHWINASFLPPSCFIAHPVHQPMMDSAERDYEFVAHLAP